MAGNDAAERFYQSMADAQYGPRNEGGSGPDGRIDYDKSKATAGSGVSETKSSFAPKDSLKYSTKGFLGNALSSMPSATYYTRLSICHPTIAHDVSKIGPDKKIIIAETATTAIFTITDLELFYTVSQNLLTRSAQGVGANITIIETHGAALLDYINKACQDLGIKAPMEAIYLLEVMFNNGNAENVDPGQSRYYFVYPLKFENMNISITEKGGQYRVNAVSPGVTAITGSVGPTINNVSALPASSLGEWVTAFQAFLNAEAQDEVDAESHAWKDEYFILIDDKWKEYKFANLKKKTNNQSTLSYIDNSKLMIQIAKGAQIPDILNSVMSATEEFQKVPTTDGGFMRLTPDGEMSDAKSIPETYRLICDLRFGEFDRNRHRYSRKYVYSFQSYKDVSVYSGELASHFNDKDVMKDRVTKLLEEQLLTKRYDYNFTGLNTEVINFDINLDLTYFRSIPVRKGHQGQDKGASTGKKMEVGASSAGDEKKKMRRPEDMPAHLSHSSDKAYGKTSDKGLVYGARPQNANELEKAQAALAKETGTNIRKGGGLYVESYALPSTQSNISLYTVPSDTQSPPPPLTSSGTNVTPDRSSGRIQLGNMQMELSGGAELAKMDIEIKGDPYWLGLSNLTKQQRGSNTGIAEFAIYEQGAPMFWLNVNSPVEPDPDTGKMEFVNNTTISGIFKVTNVISRFINGAFTQSLTAIRDIATNYELARPTLLKFTSEEILKAEAKTKARNVSLESQGYEKRS